MFGDLAVQWLAMAVDVSLKAVVLAAVAALSLRLLKIQNSNLRHRVWTGVLVGMLLMPVLSQGLPKLPVVLPETWKSSLLTSSADTKNSESNFADTSQERSALFAHDMQSGELVNQSEIGENAGSSAQERGADEKYGIGNSSLQSINDFYPAAAGLNEGGTKAASITPAQDVQRVRPTWPWFLFALWFLGVGVMALRLLAGVVYSRRLAFHCSAIAPDDLSKKGFRSLANDEHLAMICECPLICVPAALGVIRPRILLPSDWQTWSGTKLQAVIAHEQSHVRRSDGVVMFLAEINRCLYWFHPVAWWLRNQLGQLAETACDDAAIDCIGDRIAYAKYLLEVASAVSDKRGRLISVGVSMARPSNVATRINAILDFTRPLSKRLTWITSVLLLATLIPIIALAAAVQPSTENQSLAKTTTEDAKTGANDSDHMDAAGANQRESLVTEDQQQGRADSKGTNVEATVRPMSYSGRVETLQGGPIAGAKIWLAVTSYEFNSESNLENREGMLRELGIADEQGRFQFMLDASTVQEISKQPQPNQTLLVATAIGHGLDWMPLDAFDDHPTPSEKRDMLEIKVNRALGVGRFAGRALKLPTESEPVRGQLVNPEGNRLSNVKVSVESVRRPDISRLLKALEMSWDREVGESFLPSSVGGLARSELQRLIPPVTTDSNGEFELRGIGDDQMVTLAFLSDRFESRTLRVLGRSMGMMSVGADMSGVVKDVFVGRDFGYVLGPSIPVEGVVRDYDSGLPIANVLVYVERLFKDKDTRLDTHHMRAVTDREGRFRINGMPPGEGHVLEFIPSISEPHIPASQDVSLSVEDGDVKRIEARMKRGVWIEGQITDKQSGEPVLGAVDYMALETNPYALDKLGLELAWVQQRYQTNGDGHYRTLGLPGPGVLLVTPQSYSYPFAAGADTIDGYNASNGRIPTAPFPMLRASNWRLLKQIDPAADATSFTQNLVLDAGVSIPGRVITPSGKPIAELKVLGQVERDEDWRPRYDDNVRMTDRFAVYGYDGTRPRQLFFKSQDETLVGQYRLEGHVPQDIVIKLQPAVRVRGRMIDKVTELPKTRCFIECEGCLVSEKDPPEKFRIRWAFTDDDGSFEIQGLMAGLKYKMNARSETIVPNRDNRFTIDLTNAKAGDVIELGNITRLDTKGEAKTKP